MGNETNAVAEIGKEVIKRAARFLEVLTIPPFQEVGLLAQDQVKYWRFKNQVRILNKAQDYLRKKQVSPKKVPLKILVPLLEYGSLEEEQSMQERWAALLSRAADPKYSYEHTLSNIEILKQISPAEAKVLDVMFELHPMQAQESIDFEQRNDEVVKRVGVTEADYNVLLSNLLRLGLIEEVLEHKPFRRQVTHVPKFHTVKGPTELTDVGYFFVQQCRFDLLIEKKLGSEIGNDIN